MRVKTILGKKVIDAAGDDLGKVDDIEVNWETGVIESLVIGGDPKIKQRFFDSKYAKGLLNRVGAKAEHDIIIPKSDVKAIGDVVTLSVDIQEG
jgi:sporulation protein YlmC with PRC-barrel domain